MLSRLKVVNQALISGLPKISDSYARICTLNIKSQLFMLTTKLKTLDRETNRAVWKRGVTAAASTADTFPCDLDVLCQDCKGSTADPGTETSSQGGAAFPKLGRITGDTC